MASLSIAPVAPLTAARVEELGLATSLAMSEQGAALEFARLNEARLRFLAEERQWIAWTGTHWSSAQAETLAEMFYSDMIARVCERASKATEKERDFQIARAQFLGKRGMRSNVLALAQPTLAISREAFDRNAEDVFNTPSGVVDLRTGELTPSDPARMLTQCAGVAYDPEAPNLSRGRDTDTFAWLLRALGYTLTGHVREDLAFFLRGPGGNGKSTLLKAVNGVMGDYAHPLDIKFLTAGGDQGHSTDFAVLRGKRLVVTSEVNKGQRLSTSRMKDLTGGDGAAYRDIRERADRARKFAPQLKLWMYGNFDLAVPGNDDGTWRRLVKIESNHKFEKTAVRDSLIATEGAGILRVLVDAANDGIANPWARRQRASRPPPRLIDVPKTCSVSSSKTASCSSTTVRTSPSSSARPSSTARISNGLQRKAQTFAPGRASSRYGSRNAESAKIAAVSWRKGGPAVGLGCVYASQTMRRPNVDRGPA